VDCISKKARWGADTWLNVKILNNEYTVKKLINQTFAQATTFTNFARKYRMFPENRCLAN
jgi:hypothetical protein